MTDSVAEKLRAISRKQPPGRRRIPGKRYTGAVPKFSADELRDFKRVRGRRYYERTASHRGGA